MSFCQKLETASIVIGDKHDFLCLPVVIIVAKSEVSSDAPFGKIIDNAGLHPCLSKKEQGVCLYTPA